MSFAWSPGGRVQTVPMPTVKHVLYYFDGPKMVLAVDERGRQLLGVAADEDDEGTTRWVFAPAPPERLVPLLNTRTGLRALFDTGIVEVYDVAEPDVPAQSWSLAPDDVPEDLLPEPDAELPELEDGARAQLLAEQLRLVEQRSRVGRTRLYFSGRPVRGRRGISATFASDALRNYQHLVSLAYGYRRKGELRSTGPIPEREASALMLTEMPRGSVGFELVEDAEQERVTPTDLVGVISEVASLLDAAATNDTIYAERVAEFDQRIVGALNDFLSTLKKAEATLKLEAQNREYVFETERIVEAVDRTASTPRKEDDRPVTGKLIGFLPTDLRFELETPDRVIKGKISRDADLERLASFFRKRCTAHLQVITVERLGHVAEAFTLESVEDAAEKKRG